jgi:phosphinothricin acetyltransferase
MNTTSSLLKYGLRNATLDDLPAIVEIYNQTISSQIVTADNSPCTVEGRIDWFKEHDASQYPIWIYERQGKVIAWLAFSKFDSKPAYDITSELSIYISEPERSRGVGQFMMEEAIKQAANLGFECLVGRIFAENVASIKLMNKLGFKEWGRLPKVAAFDGIYRDLVILGLRVK